MKPVHIMISVFLIFCLISTAGCVNSDITSFSPQTNETTIGIAWTSDPTIEMVTAVVTAENTLGVKPVMLEKVVSYDLTYTDGFISPEYLDEDGFLSYEAGKIIREKTYTNSNIKEVMKNCSGVIFTGGSDISPSLYATPQPWHGIEEERDYDPTRDVSDYLLMSYCLDNDIPVLGICRGMQVLSVVSGAQIIQDIPQYYAEQNQIYHFEHRNNAESPDAYRDFASHNMTMTTTDSLLYRITDATTLTGCPSWHHQAVLSVEGTPLIVSGTTTASNVTIIEAVERPDKTFALGLQYHPEVAVAKRLAGAENAEDFFTLEEALCYFNALNIASGMSVRNLSGSLEIPVQMYGRNTDVATS